MGENLEQYGHSEVLEYLRHRYPFCSFGVLSWTGKNIVALKNVTINERFRRPFSESSGDAGG